MTNERPAWISTARSAIRRLGPDDLPGCRRVAADRDWNPDDRRWLRLIESGSLYGIDDPGGELAGTVALTRYGPHLAAIGMMLVASRYGRQGLGGELMAYALDAAGDRTVFLYATRYGRPLYEKLGFVTDSMVTTYKGDFRPAGESPGGSREATESDLDAIIDTDAEVFGAPRADLLGWLSDTAEQVRVIEREGTVTGFAAAVRNQGAAVLGPVVAEDTAEAQVLIADLASAVEGPVRTDLTQQAPGLLAWAEEQGLEPATSLPLMVHGGRPLPGDRSRLFAPVGPAFG